MSARSLVGRFLVARGRPLGIALTVVLALLILVAESRPQLALRYGLFDSYQRMLPRERINDSVVVIEIDDYSLAEAGQWPWPRTQMARLITRIAEQKPAALVLDIVFPEPDRMSPRRLGRLLSAEGLPAEIIESLPDSDEQLAAAMKTLPVVLGVGALLEEAGFGAGVPYRPILQQFGGEAGPYAPDYLSALRSVEPIDAAAAGHGVINRVDYHGNVRQLPTLVTVGGVAMPGLAMETLRLLSGQNILQTQVGPLGIEWVGAGGLNIPTDGDGSWWLHFSDWRQRPHLSAVTLLRGETPPGLLEGRVVFLGYTALGLQDNISTALGPMAGVQAHAEALDNAMDGRLLSRPHGLPVVEALLFVLLALVGLWVTPVLRPAWSIAVLLGLVLAASLLGMAVFQWLGWLLDVANPLAATGLVFGLMLSVSLSETQIQRRRLKEALVSSREAQARLEGELDAARRIQMGMLPLPQSVLRDDRRAAIAAVIQPAREVGGDLYDFFMLDERRLCFLIGDVSGKGLPASLFMALAKALTKGAAQRSGGEPGIALTEAATAISADNPEQLFVTVLACVLDLDTGELAWCSAGHDAPFLLREGAVTRLQGAGGPPLCVVDGFAYRAERVQLLAGDTLCLFTDGVTEARNSAGEMFGGARLRDSLVSLPRQAEPPMQLESVLDELSGFVGSAEPADDVSLLFLRWRGPLSAR